MLSQNLESDSLLHKANQICRSWTSKSIALFLEISALIEKNGGQVSISQIINSAKKKECSFFIPELPRFQNLGIILETNTKTFELTDLGKQISKLLS